MNYEPRKIEMDSEYALRDAHAALVEAFNNNEAVKQFLSEAINTVRRALMDIDHEKRERTASFLSLQ